ncbi:MAG: hypothetical protein M1495_25530 [Bacteroidetes bacterium]|nr:hypothetical protein [Bacteroidota bacterium]
MQQNELSQEDYLIDQFKRQYEKYKKDLSPDEQIVVEFYLTGGLVINAQYFRREPMKHFSIYGLDINDSKEKIIFTTHFPLHITIRKEKKWEVHQWLSISSMKKVTYIN